MINVLRKNQKALWIVIALLCIPFIFYFSNTPTGRGDEMGYGKFHGREISQLEVQRAVRLFDLARNLGMFDFLQEMVVGATSEEQAQLEFAWNHLVLHHEAERLGLQPTQTEIAAVVKGMMAFRGEKGVFDPAKFNEFADGFLPELGMSEAHVEELAADQLILEKLKTLAAAGASVPESEIREVYERAHGRLTVSVVRVSSQEVAQGIEVNDEAIAQYYEANKARLLSDEKRQVSSVSFGLTDEQKKLEGKERVAELQKMADRANEFAEAMAAPGAKFEEVAARFQVPVTKTESFPRKQPPPALNASPALVQAAFQLTSAQPTSLPLQAGDSFHILHLEDIEPPQPLTLEQAKTQIVETIKNQRTRELAAAKGNEAAQKIRQALASGTPLEAAVQQTGLPTEKIPTFAPADPPAPAAAPEPGKPAPPPAPDLQQIKGAVVELKQGEVTPFIPTPSGGVVAVLEKREPPDPANYEKTRANFATQLQRGKKEMAFYEWLRERRREAGIKETAEPDMAVPAAG